MKNLGFFFSAVLPQVIVGTIISLVIGAVVGGVVGLIIGKLTRRKEATVVPAILGSSLGVLIIAILPMVSQPISVWGGAYTAIFMRVVLFLLIPLGSIIGGFIGSIFGLIFSNRINPHTARISFFAIYVLLVASFYLKDLPTPNLSQPQDDLPLVRTFSDYNAYLCCMAFTANGQELALANSGNVHILEVNSGKLLHRFEGLSRLKMNIDEDDIKAISLSPDGKILATAAALAIKVFDVETGKLLHKLDGGNNVKLTPSGLTVVGFTGNNKSKVSMGIWDVKSGKLLHTIPLARGDSFGLESPMIFDITPDGKTLVISPTYSNNRIELWDLGTGKLRQTWAGKENQEITTVKLTPDGKTLIISQDNELVFLDLSNGKVIKRISNTGRIRILLIDLMGEKLIGYGEYLTLWQLKTGFSSKQWQAVFGPATKPIELSPDGTLLATYTIEGGVKLLRLFTPSRI